MGDEAPVEERPGEEIDRQLQVCRRRKFATLLGQGQDVPNRFAAALGADGGVGRNGIVSPCR